jgi:hypothetical protein
MVDVNEIVNAQDADVAYEHLAPIFAARDLAAPAGGDGEGVGGG